MSMNAMFVQVEAAEHSDATSKGRAIVTCLVYALTPQTAH